MAAIKLTGLFLVSYTDTTEYALFSFGDLLILKES